MVNAFDYFDVSPSVQLDIKWRREIKFYIPYEKIDGLRVALSKTLSPDPQMVDGFYLVNSVYYDTPDWEFYAAKKAGYQKRFKVRIRTYGEKLLTEKAVLEVKNRANNFVWKNKLWGAYDELSNFVSSSNLSAKLLQSGQELQQILKVVKVRTLQPKVLVKYKREAFFSNVNPDLRVTIDTNLFASAANAAERMFASNKRDLLQQGAILEVKFSGSYPNWLEKVLRAFQPELVSFSKYVEALHYQMRTKPANLSIADQTKTQDGLLWFRHKKW